MSFICHAEDWGGPQREAYNTDNTLEHCGEVKKWLTIKEKLCPFKCCIFYLRKGWLFSRLRKLKVGSITSITYFVGWSNSCFLSINLSASYYSKRTGWVINTLTHLNYWAKLLFSTTKVVFWIFGKQSLNGQNRHYALSDKMMRLHIYPNNSPRCLSNLNKIKYLHKTTGCFHLLSQETESRIEVGHYLMEIW